MGASSKLLVVLVGALLVAPIHSLSMKVQLQRRVALKRFVAAPVPVAAAVVAAPASWAAPWTKGQPLEKLNERDADRYKKIVEAKSKMKTEEEQKRYTNAICQSGVLGPSFLAWVFCN